MKTIERCKLGYEVLHEMKAGDELCIYLKQPWDEVRAIATVEMHRFHHPDELKKRKVVITTRKEGHCLIVVCSSTRPKKPHWKQLAKMEKERELLTPKI